MLVETVESGSAETAASDIPKASGGRRRWRVLAYAIPVVATLIATRGLQLNGDIHYVLGGLRSASLGGVGGPEEIFVARPLAYRLLIDLLDDGRALVTDDGTSMLAQRFIRAEAILLVVLVGHLLYAGLRRHMRRASATLVAYAVGVTLAIAPPFHFLEPDWAGALVERVVSF